MRSEQQLRDLMRARIDAEYINDSDWARDNDVPPAEVYGFTSGKRRASQRLLRALGYKRVVAYEQK